MRAAIAGGALAGAVAEADSAATDMALSQATLLPPITDPDKIICAGRNYRAHAAEAGGAPPENPSVFLRLVNTLVAHNQPIVSAPGGTATKIRMLALEGVHDAPPPPAQLSFGFRAAMPPGTAGD